MPRYYLNIHNGHGETLDEEGADHADLAAARRHAIHGIRSMLSAEVLDGEMNLKGHLDIVDSEGRVLDRVAFSEALKIVAP